MKLKKVFESKKNIAIIVLSFLLFGAMTGGNSTAVDLAKLEDRVVELTSQIEKLESENLAVQEAFADFQKENEEYIKVGKKEVEKLERQVNDAEEVLKILEKNYTQADYDKAAEKLDLLPDNNEKNKLLKRLDLAKTIIEADNAVKEAEVELNREKFDAAQDKVKNLASSDKKTQLENRLEIANANLEKKEAEEILVKVETSVKNLEANQTRENVAEAQNQINAVTDTKQKEAFNNRINAVISAIENQEAQQSQFAAVPQVPHDHDETNVYITETGSRYHFNQNCRGLRRAKAVYSDTLSHAESLGLTRCGYE